jgi:ABC-type spermidine/putrescine transport system permease subunit II
LVGWTTRWYARIMASPVLLKALANSFAVGAAAAAIATMFALLLSFAFRGKFAGKTLVFNLVLLPIVVPGIVAGIMLLIFFGYLGIRPGLFTTVLVAHVNWVLPFAFLTLYPRVSQFDRALEEAAMDLGARPLAVFRRVVFPILSPALAATALFSFSLSFDEFVRTIFVIGFDRTIPVAFWGLVVDELAPYLPAMAVIIIGVSLMASSLGYLFARRTEAGAAQVGG